MPEQSPTAKFTREFNSQNPTETWVQVAEDLRVNGFCKVTNFFSTPEELALLSAGAALKGSPLSLAQAFEMHEIRQQARENLSILGKIYLYSDCEVGEFCSEGADEEVENLVAFSEDACLKNVLSNGALHHDQTDIDPLSIQCFIQLKNSNGASTAVLPRYISDNIEVKAVSKIEPCWRVPINQDEEYIKSLHNQTININYNQGDILIMCSSCLHMRKKFTKVINGKSPKGIRSSLCIGVRRVDSRDRTNIIFRESMACGIMNITSTHGGYLHRNCNNPLMGYRMTDAERLARCSEELLAKKEFFIFTYCLPHVETITVKKTGLKKTRKLSSKHYVFGVNSLLLDVGVTDVCDLSQRELLFEVTDEFEISRERVLSWIGI
ncbi:MAG: hypothetical protein JKX76_01040 [Colwellia sp.]|nr:hypothetical protein [Colwellia sp.]